jgi:hypothetical protein
MSGVLRLKRNGSRGALFALAFLALLLKILAPPGFMVAERTDGLPFPLVICTGQGSLLLDSGKHSSPAQKPATDTPCAFSGHGAGAPPPSLDPAAAPSLADWRLPDAHAPADLALGRGLAAPPPPSQGPPRLL